MSTTHSRLRPSEREFFSALNDVVFGNPFCNEREAMVRRLVPGARGVELDREALARLVEPALAKALPDGAVSERLAAEDRRLLEAGLLYVCYHRHVPSIDDLIERQAQRNELLSAGEAAHSAVGELVARGFSETRAERYFALFFQLRRAFRFIVRSLAGECESMRRLRRALWDNVFTHDMRSYDDALWERMEDFSTLLLGETGTGKGSAAAAIGRSGYIPYLPEQRRFAANFAQGFIAINLSEHPDSLIESELFGHRKGAFTGAIEHRHGVFERCSAHGALFLDEIGEVSAPKQVKLLRVLQERRFTPVGSSESRRFAGRVIAATNRPLTELRGGGLREDFYYRLCSDVIVVPTLRQRIEESPGELKTMARLMVERIAGAASARLADPVLEALRRDVPGNYPWPGNVRELEQAVRRILLTGGFAADPAPMNDAAQLAEQLRAGQLTAQELLASYCAMIYRNCGTYAAVAERTGLDRRTARKYVEEAAAKKAA